MIEILLTALSGVACAVILWRAEPALNAMTTNTPLIVRLSVWLLVVGAAAQILALALGSLPSWPAVVLELGIACLLYCERRMRIIVPRPRHRCHDTGLF